MIDADHLIEQVSEATVTTEDGEHLVVSFYSKFIHSDGKPRLVQQASAALQLGDWRSFATTCAESRCCRPDHLADAVVVKDDTDLLLVQAAAPSLATLYRRARNKGLLVARTSYGA